MKGNKLRYSGQAQILLEGLKDGTIDIDKFEEWVINKKFVVGGGYLVEYLEKLARGEI
jgi:hypothetical protein